MPASEDERSETVAEPLPGAIAVVARDRGWAAVATRLLEQALPGEGFTDEDLATVLWDDPGVVLAADDDSGFVAAAVRTSGSRTAGYVKVLAVDPAQRRSGRGGALLAAAESWCRDQGATEVHLAGVAPVYLWPGVDVVTMVPMLCLAERSGYQARTSELNMVLPSTFRRAPAAAVGNDRLDLVRLVDDADVAAVVELVARRWPHWSEELDLAVEGGTAIGAFRGRAGGPDDLGGAAGAGGTALGRAVGFVCHSVSRLGLLGPMGTDPEDQGGGVGGALVGAVGADLQAAGVETIEICWVGPTTFYAKLGATVNRSFRTYRKRF